MHRRCWWLALGLAGGILVAAAAAPTETARPVTGTVMLEPVQLVQAGQTVPGVVHAVTEMAFEVVTEEGDPFLDHEVEVVFREPGGREVAVPAFWAGGQVWKVRYGPRMEGSHRFAGRVAKGRARLAGPVEGVVEAQPYRGDNPLLRHGPVGLGPEGKYFAHADGKPFFWLADSWWHAMAGRLTDEGLATLVADRVAKGFTVIQLAVANPCDIAPFDDRGGNRAGHAWTEDFGTINPAYWDLADQRMEALVEAGLMPSVVGSWGYYLRFMGKERMEKHWRYVIARYGAFPLAWTLCGESRLPWYPLIGKGTDDGYRQTLGWTEISHYVAAQNTTGRLLGIHPGPPLWFHDAQYAALADFAAIDFFFGMGGHGGNNEYAQVLRCLDEMQAWREGNPGKPSIIGELCWEGMYGGNCGPFVQRVQFWAGVLNGAPGHCYGTDSLWQMNTRTQPFGESVSGFTWGNWPWEEAMHWEGGIYVSVGKRILEKFPWWRLEPHPEWVSQTREADGSGMIAAAAGIPGELRIIYMVRKPKLRLQGLSPGKAYDAVWISPLDGREYPLEAALVADGEGRCPIPRTPLNQDFLLVVRE